MQVRFKILFTDRQTELDNLELEECFALILGFLREEWMVQPLPGQKPHPITNSLPYRLFRRSLPNGEWRPTQHSIPATGAKAAMDALVSLGMTHLVHPHIKVVSYFSGQPARSSQTTALN